MSDMYVMSLGWGVQSWTLAAMMALNQIERVDYLVHADTKHERQGTYEFREKWEPWLGEHGLDIVTVTGERTDAVRDDWADGSVLIPAFTINKEGGPGQVRRQCTHDWKITPIRRFVRSKLKERGVPVTPDVVRVAIGISRDEWHRMRDSDVAYITNVFPLIDARLTRLDCISWLQANDLPVPPKSSCTFCPYRSLASWKELKTTGGPDWQEAVDVDAAIRDRRDGFELFVHPGRTALADAVTIPEDFGASQPELEGCDSGYCWT